MPSSKSQYWPAALGIKSPFTIPSGIVTTVPSVLARIARDVPEIGFLTTKTISVHPREGYREPVLHEYHPGCFVNAVGLANPGAESFLASMKHFLPLHGNKPLLVSIMGSDAQEFLQCASILEPIADAFELNLSCPHVKDSGQTVGSDPGVVASIIRLLKEAIRKPIVPKLSPNLTDVRGMAQLCREAGADGLCLINTVGPGTAVDQHGNPILSNVTGGLSGAGILPVGLKAVRETTDVGLPIIAAGGISTAAHVRAYRRAGASLFAVGSSLAGKTTAQIAQFFKWLAASLESEEQETVPRDDCPAIPRTLYLQTRVRDNLPFGDNLFRLRLEHGPSCDPGQFFFLRLPGVGEKPFSPLDDAEPAYLVRAVGPFTRALQRLERGDPVYLRGPYGKGFPDPGGALILLAGGTGAAPILMAAKQWRDYVARGFFGFSAPVADWFSDHIRAVVPDAGLAIDSPGQVGMVLEDLARDLQKNPRVYESSRIFICGPAAMAIAAVSILNRIVPSERIFVAREDIMKCGIGLCGSCGTKSGLRSCTDGPVMNPEQ